MKLKIALLSATAFGLLSAIGAAYAGDGNTAKIVQIQSNNSATADQEAGTNGVTMFTQDGDNNSATVKQTGNGNSAGTHENVTDTYGVMYQHGDHNLITIAQSGGDSIASSAGSGGLLLQIHNGNTANITQNGAADVVGKVVQTGTLTGSALRNKLTIDQENASDGIYTSPASGSSDYHYGDQWIDSVTQTSGGGSANTLSLKQQGGVYGAGDTIWTVVQNGSGNDGTVTQNGRLNYLASFSQVGDSNTGNVTVTGDSNGVGPFTSAAAVAVGITELSLRQTGEHDLATYNALGNGNLFGIVQTSPFGTGHNSATGSVGGDNNEAAVSQNGVGNVTDFTQGGDSNALGVSIVGDDNGVGGFRGASSIGVINGSITQSGGDNVASIAITGNDNNYGATQTGGNNSLILSIQGASGSNGNNNNIAVNQAGSDTAAIHVTGNQNVLGAQQWGVGTNSLEATITGDSNNWSGSFNGDAALGLTPGSISQQSTGALNNDVNLTVATSSNLFAVKQNGNDNHVTGSVTLGTGNQAAVLQIGSGNHATFNQNGGGNNVGITQ